MKILKQGELAKEQLRFEKEEKSGKRTVISEDLTKFLRDIDRGGLWTPTVTAFSICIEAWEVYSCTQRKKVFESDRQLCSMKNQHFPKL